MARLLKEKCLLFLESGEYSDFTITCRDVNFQVHRMFICQESDVLTAACNGCFKEAAERRYNFSEEHPSVISRVLLFMYTSKYYGGKLPDFFQKWGVNNDELSEFEVHILVYQVADMLEMKSLKKMASDKFLEHINADAFDPWPKDLTQALSVLYTNTRVDDEDLRYRTTMALVTNRQVILEHADTLQVIEEHEPILWKACSSIVTSFSTKLLIAQQSAAGELKKAEEIAATKYERYKADTESNSARFQMMLKKLKEMNLQCCHGITVSIEGDCLSNFEVADRLKHCMECANSGRTRPMIRW